jgi:predicted ATPase/DNA-binding CsgD family transcriptional regulator/Tfp pilus assembly protein PilF
MHPPNNLPLQLTSFIGREREIAEVKRLLSTSRLLTLTGPGGSGKTRLALQAASQVVGEYPNGVYFVNLAPITNPRLVVFAIAQTLDVKEASGQPLLETLKAYPQSKEMLLLLDNFEQVLGAASTMVDLLVSAPDLKVLVTSRESLHVQGEQLYSVPPLDLPDATQKVPIEELSHNEAVALFVERARSAKYDFELSKENAPTVAQICRRLDGLPLAIELAAARIRVLTPQAMLSRLESRLDLLTGGAHDLPTRHQTLRGTVDWSYNLLGDGEKQLFKRMSVFLGGGTLEDVEDVCNYDRKLQVGVLDGVQSLVNKSLMQRREGREGEPRFVMLETIHEYAGERLRESGEADAVHRAHALYFMRLAEEAKPHLLEATQQEWLDRLEWEHDNIRTALQWVRQRGASDSAQDAEQDGKQNIEVGLRIGAAIWRFWQVRGYLSEGREQLHQLLSLAERFDCCAQWKASAMNGEGVLAQMLGDFATAQVLFQGALDAASDVGDDKSVADSLNGLGILAEEQYDVVTARGLYEQSLDIRRQIGDRWGMAASLHNLGSLAASEGDYAAARTLYEQSLTLHRETGNRASTSLNLTSLAHLAHSEGDYAAARALYEQSLAIEKEIGHKRGVGGTLNNLGKVALSEEDYTTARALFEQSLAIEREIGYKAGIAASLLSLASLAHSERDYATARALYRDSLESFRGTGRTRGIVWSLAGLGEINVESGHPARGAILLGAVEGPLEAMKALMSAIEGTPYKHAVASARTQLGDVAFERARQQGRAMSMEQAIAYAREDTADIWPSTKAWTESRPRSNRRQGYSSELSRRELEVLRLMAAGLTNKQIAERLFLSTNTVRAHLYSVYSKLDVSTRGAAIRFAADHGLI